MEFGDEGAMDATPTQLPLMENGPVYDRSVDAELTTSATSRQHMHAFTPISLDLGPSELRTPGNYVSNVFVTGEASGAGMAAMQYGFMSEGFQGMQVRAVGESSEGGHGVVFQNFSDIFGQSSQAQKNAQTPAAGSVLHSLPESIPHVEFSDRINEQMQMQQQNLIGLNNMYQNSDSSRVDKVIETFTQAIKNLGEITATLVQLEASREQRHEQSCKSLELAAQTMKDFMAAMMKKHQDKEERLAKDRKLDLGLKMSNTAPEEPRYNWMFGHGISKRTGRRTTTTQTKYARAKTAVRRNATWFTHNATAECLKPVFMQFMDTPRVSIDGCYIRDLLMDEVETSERFAYALVRTLRNDEKHRFLNSLGECHYVIHTWAERVFEGASLQALEVLFRKPSSDILFASCNKVVAFLHLDDAWASLSMDFGEGISQLIHPSLASENPHMVLEKHRPWMAALTLAAQAHMKKLGDVVPPKKEWQYAVALKGGAPVPINNTGIATAFYSIPKDDQFQVVSHDTLLLAKQTFVYSLMRLTYPETKEAIKKGTKKKNPKRGLNGKFVPQEEPVLASDLAVENMLTIGI